MLGFFLEGVQHVDDPGEADGVNGPIRVAVEVIHDFDDASSAESLERLREGRLEAQLRIPQRAADLATNFLRETPQVLLTGPTQRTGLG